MRLIFLIIALHLLLQGFGQQPGRILFSGIILNSDSIPVSEVAIINTRNGKTVLTNSSGFFQTEIDEKDSLLVHHISYQRKFINENDNGKITVVELELHELSQVDVGEDRDMKNLEQTVIDIRKKSALKVPESFDSKARQQYFVNQFGSHNKGFSPYFGISTQYGLSNVLNLFRKKKDLSNKKTIQIKKH